MGNQTTATDNLIDRLLWREKVSVAEWHKTPPAIHVRQARMDILDVVKSVGQKGDLGQILALERRFLEYDLTEHTTSPAQRSSLELALEDLDGAEKTVPLTADPVLYEAVDASHSHRKTRVGGLPKDAARKFFSGNSTRLLNMDKARLSGEEKKIIQGRRDNMRSADKIYSAMQRKALGLPPKEKGREQGRSR